MINNTLQIKHTLKPKGNEKKCYKHYVDVCCEIRGPLNVSNMFFRSRIFFFILNVNFLYSFVKIKKINILFQ